VIVRVSAMQALVDLAAFDQRLRHLVHRRLRRVLKTGSPAERARARKLLPGLVGADRRPSRGK